MKSKFANVLYSLLFLVTLAGHNLWGDDTGGGSPDLLNLQSAIDAAGAAYSGGAPILVEVGPSAGFPLNKSEFTIERSLKMRTGVVLCGDSADNPVTINRVGGGSVVIWLGQNTKDPLPPPEYRQADYAGLKNLILKPHDHIRDVVSIYKSQGVSIDNVEISDLQEGDSKDLTRSAIRVYRDCDGMSITNCLFKNLSGTDDDQHDALRAIRFADSKGGISNVDISNNHFENIFIQTSDLDTPEDADAILVDFPADTVTNVDIAFNTFINAGKRAVKDRTGGLVIRNNVMIFEYDFYTGNVDRPFAAISIQSTNSDINHRTVIEDNYILGDFKNCVFSVGQPADNLDAHYSLISNNFVTVPSQSDQLSTDAIRIIEDDLAGEHLIFDNTFWGTFEHGVHSTRCDTIVLLHELDEAANSNYFQDLQGQVVHCGN